MRRTSPRSLTPLGAALVLCGALCGRPAAAPAPRDWGGADGPYLKLVHEQVHPRWMAFLQELGRLDKGYQDPTLASEILLVVDAHGKIVRVDYVSHAPLKGFDDAPGDLARDIGQLPAPPPPLYSDDGNVYIRWRFSRQAPGCEEYRVVERRLLLAEAVPRLVKAGRSGEAAGRIREEASTGERPVLLRIFVEHLGRWAAGARAPLTRELAAAILAHVPEAQAELAALLGDHVPAVRVRALEALSGQPLSPVVVPALHRLLETDDRAIAALLLAKLRDKAAVPALRRALAAGQRPAETAAALRALDDSAEAGRIAAHLLGQPDHSLAGAIAARAVGDPAHTPLLLKCFTLGSEAVRLAALDALGAMGTRAPPEARKAVLRAMSDMSPKVRAHAMRASAGFGDHSVGMRYRLIDSLADPDAVVRAAAAAALVEVGGEEARDELLRVVKDHSVAVRAATLQAAMAHPYPSATTLIARLRKDPAVEEEAGQPGPPEDHPNVDEPAPAGGPPRRAPLLSSRVVTLPTAEGEEERLVERLLGAVSTDERLRAAAGWLALERKAKR